MRMECKRIEMKEGQSTWHARLETLVSHDVAGGEVRMTVLWWVVVLETGEVAVLFVRATARTANYVAHFTDL